MVRHTGQPLRWVLIALAACWFAPVTCAEEIVTPPPQDVETRLLRLEQQNEALRQALERHGEQAPSPVALPDEQGTGLTTAQVLRIVSDYLKDQDEHRRSDEAQKKKDAEEKGYEVGTDVAFKPSWRDGFNAETANQDFRVHFGGRIQADAAWFHPSQPLKEAFPDRWQDGADFRRLRLRADGTAHEFIDFILDMEFAQAINGLTTHPFPADALVRFKTLPLLGNLTIGNCKEPFSLEDYGTSDSFGIFMERSAADSAFSPDRNLGFLWHDSYFGDRVIWAAGIFRTNSDARSGNAFDYGDGEYAYTARLAFVPCYEADGRCWLLIGTAFSHRTYDPDDSGFPGLPNDTNPSRGRFITRVPLRVNSPVFLDVSNLVADSSQLHNLQVALNLGPLLLQGEFYFTQLHNVRRGALAANVPRLTQPAFDGWYVQASYFLTGEYHPLDRKYGRLGRVRPNENWFCVRQGPEGNQDGFAHGWGAWEIAARFGIVNLDSPALDQFDGVPGIPGSGVAAVPGKGFQQDVTLSLSLFFNANLRMQWNYAYAYRGVDATVGRGGAGMLGMRLWWDF